MKQIVEARHRPKEKNDDLRVTRVSTLGHKPITPQLVHKLGNLRSIPYPKFIDDINGNCQLSLIGDITLSSQYCFLIKTSGKKVIMNRHLFQSLAYPTMWCSLSLFNISINENKFYQHKKFLKLKSSFSHITSQNLIH